MGTNDMRVVIEEMSRVAKEEQEQSYGEYAAEVTLAYLEDHPQEKGRARRSFEARVILSTAQTSVRIEQNKRRTLDTSKGKTDTTAAVFEAVNELSPRKDLAGVERWISNKPSKAHEEDRGGRVSTGSVPVDGKWNTLLSEVKASGQPILPETHGNIVHIPHAKTASQAELMRLYVCAKLTPAQAVTHIHKLTPGMHRAYLKFRGEAGEYTKGLEALAAANVDMGKIEKTDKQVNARAKTRGIKAEKAQDVEKERSRMVVIRSQENPLVTKAVGLKAQAHTNTPLSAQKAEGDQAVMEVEAAERIKAARTMIGEAVKTVVLSDKEKAELLTRLNSKRTVNARGDIVGKVEWK